MTSSCVVVGDALLDPESGETAGPAAVVIDNGRVTAAGRRDTVSFPRNAEVFDRAGLTLLPGLIDTHVHPGMRATASTCRSGLMSRAIAPTFINVSPADAASAAALAGPPGAAWLPASDNVPGSSRHLWCVRLSPARARARRLRQWLTCGRARGALAPASPVMAALDARQLIRAARDPGGAK